MTDGIAERVEKDRRATLRSIGQKTAISREQGASRMKGADETPKQFLGKTFKV